ncbi:MAG TPA: hypothetical protein VFT72_03565 [Opitutaceae bacterium]|nr:hypothetical protein [Opitutaceae bacterium]
MLLVLNFALVLCLSWQLAGNGLLLRELIGVPRFLASLALAFFLNAWIGFLVYALIGWGNGYAITNLGLLSLLIFYLRRTQGPIDVADKCWLRRPNLWFLAIAALVMVRFATGVYKDDSGGVWSNYNFVDTAFHLSIVRSFLNSQAFPPMSLNVAEYPLKYHFLADFYVAYLYQFGLSALTALRVMNIIGALCMVGTTWAVLERWLRLEGRWIALAFTLFFFLNPAITNVVHYLTFRPAYYNTKNFFEGLLAFPYFNFESTLTNLFEPQRGLVFSFPIILLALNAFFTKVEDSVIQGQRLVQAMCLVCLMPFAHIVGFAVLAASSFQSIIRFRSVLAKYWLPILGFTLLCALQLLYIFCFGPPIEKEFGAWDVATAIPLAEFGQVGGPARRVLFWIFANGDYLIWGCVFGAIAIWRVLRKRDTGAAFCQDVSLLKTWWWYFVVVVAAFIFINVYRYSFAWGDSNKFVLFLNLAISLLIVAGLNTMRATRWKGVARTLCLFFAVLCVAPSCYEVYQDLFIRTGGKVLLFHPNGIAAANWFKKNAEKKAIVLTEACSDFNVVASVAGLPTPAGIYADSNPYRQVNREKDIPAIYEHGRLDLLRKLDVRYVYISRNERLRYKLHPLWRHFVENKRVVAFQAGEPGQLESVVVLDVRKLLHSSHAIAAQ